MFIKLTDPYDETIIVNTELVIRVTASTHIAYTSECCELLVIGGVHIIVKGNLEFVLGKLNET